jgi:DNA repair exonuclease SbcCD nuclease subunit
LHAADLHLGSPFKGLAADGELPARFADCTFRAFDRLIALAIGQQVDAVLLAGDLYDQRDRSLRARLHLMAGLLRLDAAGIRSFLVHGNHDPLEADPGGVALPKSVKVFGPQWEEVDAGEYRVQGVSFATAEVRENLAAGFHRQSDGLTIGLLHCNLGGQAEHSNYAPCNLGDLERAGLDYWALGHVHTRAVHSLSGNALAAYPGNLQGRHVNEPGPRGALLVTLDPSRQAAPAVTFVPLDVVRWHRIAVSIEDDDAVDALIDRALAAIARVAVDAEGHAVRLQLTGRGALHAQFDTPEKLAELTQAIRARLEGPVVLESVRDDTAGAWELEPLIASGGLVCEVALKLREPPAAAEIDRLWKDSGLDALDAALAEAGLAPLRVQAPALVQEAASRAVDLLEADR